MKKISFILIAAIACMGVAAAQNAEEERIQLPEMTTTVSGDTVVAGRDAVPDFSKVVPSAGAEKNIMPKLPGERIMAEDAGAEPVADFVSGDHKNVYAQGLVGGGFPGDFIGDFSVYKTEGTDPFRIDFSHFSRNGYGKHDGGDGFFDNGTKLYAEKSFRAMSSDFTIGGRYDRAGSGLQGKSDNFYDMNSQKVTACFLFDHVFGDSGFEFYSDSEAYWYNRYCGMKLDDPSLTIQEKDIDVFFADPGFVFSFYSQGFSASLDLNMQIESFLGKHDTAAIDDLFRVDAAIVTGYENDIVTAFAKGGIAGGTEIGEGRTIVPFFATGAEVRVEMGSTGRTLVVGLNGGLETKHEEFAGLERKYKFAQLDSLTDETTDWFVNSKIVLPLFETISFNSGVEFRKSAFGNGIFEADYSHRMPNGVYKFHMDERTQVTTDNGITFRMGIFTVRGGWRAHWSHVPANDYRHTVEGTIGYDDDDGKWGFSAGVAEAIDSDSDKCPNLRASIYFNIKTVMKLSLEVEDAIKLFSGSDRDFVETDYLVRAGSVTLLSRFFF
ncbi:MAG: hypothetical protein KBS64_01805 [Treponema sp.]|nr:hypothetical protein [Candidatus Treponema equi]